MKLKKALMYIFIIAFSLSLLGCGLVGSLRTNRAENTSNLGEELPEWLTVAHRAQAAEQLQTVTEEDENREYGAGPLVSQPAMTQPGSTQPEQQEQASGTPRWQQPGTMEYIAKQQLDQLVFHYKKLNTNIADLEGEKDKDQDKLNDLKAKIQDRADRYEILSEIATNIVLSLDREYGIKPPPVETKETTTDSTWFHNWEDSPSGFGN